VYIWRVSTGSVRVPVLFDLHWVVHGFGGVLLVKTVRVITAMVRRVDNFMLGTGYGRRLFCSERLAIANLCCRRICKRYCRDDNMRTICRSR
jgi:hypothetical protein